MESTLSKEDDSYFRSSSLKKDENISEIDLRVENLLLKDNSRNSIPFTTKNNYSKSEFEVIELCGKGAYAKVIKAMYKKTNEIKAIKIIDKSFMEKVRIYKNNYKENKLYQVYLEKDILQRLDHPNIIKIDGVFEESDKIFFVLEHLNNGDFYEFLKNNAPLKFETAQFYVAQLVNALEYLHLMGISHRDLKPENLMLDNNLHLKIIDFATSKIKEKIFDKTTMSFVNELEIIQEADDRDSEEEENQRKSKNTFVGTAEYVSPEVLNDQSAGSAADLWALGCIIYQMFSGCSPFKDKTDYLIFKKILDLNYTMPDNIPEDAKNIIKSLLIIDPDKRLGSGSSDENNFRALKSNPFFKNVDFSNLNSIEPPFKKDLIITVSKNIVPKSKQKQDSYNELQRHKNAIQVIKQDIIEKKSPWFHYNTRKVVLDNTPKIEYIDPEKNIVKGVIYLTKLCSAKYVDNNIFELYTPKRTFKFRTPSYESGVWAKIINETIEKFSKS